MKTIAYAAQEFASQVALAAGVTPLTSPPLSMSSRGLADLLSAKPYRGGADRASGRSGKAASGNVPALPARFCQRAGGAGARPRLLYLALHGLPDQPYLYGSGWLTALSGDQIETLDLTGAVIFAPCCHLTDGPLLPVLLRTGAEAVIAGSGPNYSPHAHTLGRAIRRFLALNVPAAVALRLARAYLALHSDHPAALDTLTFQLFTPKEA